MRTCINAIYLWLILSALAQSWSESEVGTKGGSVWEGDSVGPGVGGVQEIREQCETEARRERFS